MPDERPDASQRTEEATPKRREEARRKGQVPQSREPATAVAYLVLAAALAGMAASGAGALARAARAALSGELAPPATPEGVAALAWRVAGWIAEAVLPFALPALVAGVLVQFLVTGPVLTTAPLAPKLERISPIAGAKRLFSLRTLVELVKSLVKIAVLGAVAALALADAWPELLRAPLASPGALVRDWLGAAGRLAGLSAFAFALLALGDWLYQRWEHGRSLRMTKQEVRDEAKETEGDPQIRARIRQVQSEMARRRMMAEVPKADVVVVNPTHVAVALRYAPGRDPAPRVVAKGKGALARRIREIAEAHGVPVREERSLARSLYALVKVGETIPEALFEAAAILLAEIYRARRRR